MNLSLCITTYNRWEMCIESFKDIVNDPRIVDIVILDDCSTDNSYQKLRDYFFDNKKVRIVKQLQNRGMSQNKRDAIALAKSEWAIILDDDNRIGPEYLNALELTLDLFYDQSEIYLPDFANSTFDYRKYDAIGFWSKNIKPVSQRPLFGALMNTCNYVVNRDFYLRVWKYNPEMKGTDTIWHALQHLKAGGCFYVVPGMKYYHRMHDDSGFMKDVSYNMEWAIKLENEIKNL